MRTQIFISYRRDGGLESAKYLHSQLQEDYEVFFDMESLRSGKFDDNIETAIVECTDFLLILSPNIFDRFAEDGDWIFRELSLALEHDKNLIPIFLPNFTEPKIENETIQTAMRYNGIHLVQSDAFGGKLRSFLKSNKKCVLPIECVPGRFVLTESAIDALKEAYRQKTYSKETSFHVVLQLPDANKSAEVMKPDDVDDKNRQDWLDFYSQHLICRYQKRKRIIEVAIEYMMQDAYNLSTVPFLPYLKKQQLAHEVYLDPDGRRHTYYTVAIWAQIIEELLLEITLTNANRTTYYRNQWNNYTAIDCVVNRVAQGVKGKWSFTSHARPEELTLENQSWYPLFQLEVLKLKPETLLQCVLPDFYYRIALELCYCEIQEFKEVLLDPKANVHVLANYWYGLS